MEKAEEQKALIMSVINTVGWWLVHAVAAINSPHEAMVRASDVMPAPLGDLEEIEDLDEDTEEDDDIPF